MDRYSISNSKKWNEDVSRNFANFFSLRIQNRLKIFSQILDGDY